MNVWSEFNDIKQSIDRIDIIEVQEAMNKMFNYFNEKIGNLEIQMKSYGAMEAEQETKKSERNDQLSLRKFISENIKQIKEWNKFNQFKIIYEGKSLPDFLNSIEGQKDGNGRMIVALTYKNQIFGTFLKPTDKNSKRVVFYRFLEKVNGTLKHKIGLLETNIYYCNELLNNPPKDTRNEQKQQFNFIYVKEMFGVSTEGKGRVFSDLFGENFDFEDYSLTIKSVLILEWYNEFDEYDIFAHPL